MKKPDQKTINNYSTNRRNFIKKAAAIGLTTTFSVPYVSNIFAATSNPNLPGGQKINWKKEGAGKFFVQ
jgi:Ni,Fe-hydrogenase I small subunit